MLIHFFYKLFLENNEAAIFSVATRRQCFWVSVTKKKNEQAPFVKTELTQQIYRPINKQHCHLELPAVNSNACIFLKSLWLPAKKIIQNKYVLKICFVADRWTWASVTSRTTACVSWLNSCRSCASCRCVAASWWAT